MKVNDFQISENFNLSEFECNDNTQAVKVVPELVEKLEILRGLVSDHLGEDTSLIINSGYRTPDYNRKVGGAKNSQHLKGTAADIRIPKRMDADILAKFAEQAGFDGIGRYDTFVHCDVRGSKARWDNQ